VYDDYHNYLVRTFGEKPDQESGPFIVKMFTGLVLVFMVPIAVFSLYENISVEFSDKPRIVQPNPFRESEMSELDSNIIAVTGFETKKY